MIRSSVRSAGLAILLTVNGCGSLVSSDPGTRLPGLTVAEAALQSGSGQIALQVSEGVLRGSPNNAHALEVKADALSLLGDYDGAGAIYQALLTKDPNSIRANIGLGRVRLSKNPAGAEVLFQQVLKSEPRNETALNNLGIARDLQGRHAEAQTAYRQALAVNADLDSAEVNLALSMAMTGQGQAAIQLLRAKAGQPGAPVKIKHDYAVVLAMAGNRAEAERVLGDDLSPDEVRQVLDSVTGTHTRIARDTAPDQMGAVAQTDGVPPDVVQLPDETAQSSPSGTARLATAPIAASPAVIAAAAAAPPPTVVRPQPVAATDADNPATEPVSPVAAAATYQRPLALPIQNTAAIAETRTVDAAADAPAVTPAVVAVAQASPPRRVAAVSSVTEDADGMALPKAPPSPPVLRPVPLPPGYQPKPATTAQAEPPAQATADAARPDSAGADAKRTGGARADVARADSTRPDSARTDSTRTDSARADAARADSTRPDSVRSVSARADIVPRPSARDDGPRADSAHADRMRESDARPAARPTEPASTISRVATAAPSAPAPATAPAAAVQAATHAGPAVMPKPGPRAISSIQRDEAAFATPARNAQSFEAGPTVQLAAAASPESARSYWQQLVHRFPEALGQHGPRVVRFEHDGMVFWRVRAEGFASVSEAQTLCARMHADGQDCFVPRS